MKELIEIQSALKAPKNQRNNFGKYNYRSCEDILEAVKPLLKENNCFLTLTDEVEEIGGVLMIKAIARISKEDVSFKVSAYAGIDLNRKGMDSAQSFGASSSYARKYALNGLFAIDDTKDSDTKEPPKTEPKKVNPKPIKPVTKAVKKEAPKVDDMQTARELFKKSFKEPLFTKDEISSFRSLMKEEIDNGAKGSEIITLIELKLDTQINK